jgi:YHS domain-containing protein
MKTFYTYVVIVVCLAACKSKPVAGDKPVKDTAMQFVTYKEEPQLDIANIHFATQTDTTCHMPLTAGVTDTLHYKGKIYGFCSAACKHAFENQLHQHKNK